MMPDIPSSMYFANGHDGQRVFILPEQDLVVVRLGLNGDFSNNDFLKGILESTED
jgi:CubicO group peptidase (beta-lactamase class C family)